MSRFQQKITGHTKSKEDDKINRKETIHRNQRWDNRERLILMPEKDFKPAMIKMLQWAIMNTLKTNEKVGCLRK